MKTLVRHSSWFCKFPQKYTRSSQLKAERISGCKNQNNLGFLAPFFSQHHVTLDNLRRLTTEQKRIQHCHRVFQWMIQMPDFWNLRRGEDELSRLLPVCHGLIATLPLQQRLVCWFCHPCTHRTYWSVVFFSSYSEQWFLPIKMPLKKSGSSEGEKVPFSPLASFFLWTNIFICSLTSVLNYLVNAFKALFF